MEVVGILWMIWVNLQSESTDFYQTVLKSVIVRLMGANLTSLSLVWTISSAYSELIR